MGILPATLIRKGERTAVKATLQVAPVLDFEAPLVGITWILWSNVDCPSWEELSLV